MNQHTNKSLLMTCLCILLSSCAQEIIETPTQQTVSVVPNQLRPSVMGRNAGISTGHPLTSAVALEILQNGGNAFDIGQDTNADGILDATEVVISIDVALLCK